MFSFLKSCKKNMTNKDRPESAEPSGSNGFVSFPPRFDDGERTLTCPTCGGSGKLTQEHENDLVALIPVRDNRLKPRIKTYVFIAVLIISLIVGALVAVFLFPRVVQIKLTTSSAFNITLARPNDTDAYMVLNNTLHIQNNNFFGVTVKSLSQQITWGGSYVVADQSFDRHFYVPAKSSTYIKANVSLVFKGKQLSTKMKRACCWFEMMFIVVSQGHANGLTVSQDVSNKVYEYTECLENDPDWIHKCA